MKRTYIQPSAKSIVMLSREHLLTYSTEGSATTTVGGQPGSFDVKGELSTLPWQQ